MFIPFQSSVLTRTNTGNITNKNKCTSNNVKRVLCYMIRRKRVTLNILIVPTLKTYCMIYAVTTYYTLVIFYW